jgi:hypothetical protein
LNPGAFKLCANWIQHVQQVAFVAEQAPTSRSVDSWRSAVTMAERFASE